MKWQKGSRSGSQGNCVEVAHIDCKFCKNPKNKKNITEKAAANNHCTHCHEDYEADGYINHLRSCAKFQETWAATGHGTLKPIGKENKA